MTRSLSHNIVDNISSKGIVSIRDKLLKLPNNQIMRLESGDPSFDIPIHVKEAYIKALKDGHTHYTAGPGILPLRQAISEKLLVSNKIIANEDNIYVTSGAMNALYVTFRAICSPGDEVIVQDPTWTETADNVTMAGGMPVRCYYPLDREDLEEKITPKTRAIVINSPHNPTGYVFEEKSLKDILDVADKYGLYVVSDEAYEHVIFNGRKHISIGSLNANNKNIISIFSMSKSYAMSGLRVGYLACHDDQVSKRISKLLRCTINGVNSAAQHASVAALIGPQDCVKLMCNEYQERRDILVNAIYKSPWLFPINPDGTFFVWAKILTHHDGWTVSDYLVQKSGIGSAPGEVFGPSGNGCLRFSFSIATDKVKKAADLLQTITLSSS